ncbi:MAG: OmpA family protein, partial [Saprospiraceae bacterium]|nr:OmpA family protein [Saprospiraceae bacterium]
NGWGPANPLEKVNGEFIVRQPAMGELYNNQVLFFSSNKEGGFGGYDLYYATFDGETFSEAVNLGETINTPGNEEAPYYIAGTLYFSSDRHLGMGGFDIFNSVWNGSNWSAPNNIGKPYNSPADDMYFRIDEEGYTGLLVSNREGTSSVESKTCCDDIWLVSKEKIILELVTNMFDQETQKPLNSVKIVLSDFTADEVGESKTRVKQDTNSYSFSLITDKAYKIIASREGYFSDTLEFNTVDVTESQIFQKNISLKPLPPEPVDEYEEYTINEPIRLNNIYYDYDDDKILLDAEQDLTIILELMNEYPEMVIELSSHTDSRGLGRYNEDLSQRRANSAKAWLVNNGVTSERIQPVGYGESVILNKCVNGVKCTDEEHRFNRRTEFKIVDGPTTIQIKKTRLIKRTPN